MNFQTRSPDKTTTMNYSLKHLILFVAIFITAAGAYAQRDIPPKPSLQTSVYDEADVLSASEEQSLEQKLISYADNTSTQIVVVTLISLEG